jgi:hypothetical protein
MTPALRRLKKKVLKQKSLARSWLAFAAVTGLVCWAHWWGLQRLSLPVSTVQATGVAAFRSVGFVVERASAAQPKLTPRKAAVKPALPAVREVAPVVEASAVLGAVPVAAASALAPAVPFDASDAAMPELHSDAAHDETPLAPALPPVEPIAESTAAGAHPVVVPESVRLRYQVQSSKLPFGVQGDLRWQRQGDVYEAQLALRLLGMDRTQGSRGRVTEQGLMPLRFSDKYRSEVAAHFEWDAGVVRFSANTPDVALQPGAQDRLGVMVQLAALVGADSAAYPPGSSISLQVVGPRAAETWVFAVQGLETLDLPGGRLEGFKLMRQAHGPYDQQVELWLAPALAYLPARIRITQSNGEFVDQLWAGSEPHGS